MIILSILERDPAEVSRLLLSPPAGADAVEVRLDRLKRAEPSSWFPGTAAAPRPVIAACRARAEGGFFAGSERRRGEALLTAARAGVAYVDVELGSAMVKSLADLAPARVILSHHDRRRTRPAAELHALYRKMAAVAGVAVVKIVTTALDPADILEIRSLLKRVEGGKVPLIAFAMGGPGIPSRILAPSWGSWATFVCRRRGEESAPGQVTLEEAVDVYRIGEIDEETRLTGITGFPVAHSLSPVMHNAGYRHQRINFRYLPFAAPKLDKVPGLMRRLRIRGLSVTAPHKIAMARKMKKLGPGAGRLGAINTVVNDGRRLFGFNTDARGLLGPLRRLIDPSGRTVVIAGAGGSARAIAVALRELEACVIICSRREKPGRDLAKRIGGMYVAPRRLASATYDILINATPAGMDGRSMPVPASAVKGSLVADLVYSPLRTPLLAAAVERGIPIVTGLDVLLAQGVEQYALFTGREAPAESMRQALVDATSRAGA
jgi:3-dehydroquinate dehydratase/shikimate dehydrogenase